MAITILSYLLLEDGSKLILENYSGGALLLELDSEAGADLVNAHYMQYRDKQEVVEYRNKLTHVGFRDKREIVGG